MTLHEKLERLTETMTRIEDAMEALDGVEECPDVIDILHDKLVYLGVQRDEIHARIEEMDAREQAEQVRDYWQAVV